jgi:predicted kinase
MSVDAAAIQRHIQAVRELSREGGPLAVNAPTATTSNPAWWADGEAAGARRETHERLIDEYRSGYPGVLRQHRAIVLAGPPGAGKSTILGKLMPPAERATYLWLDNDQAKAALARQAYADGSYGQFIKPPVVRDLESVHGRFLPLELAPLFHNEARYIIGVMRQNSIRAGENIIIDTVLSNADRAAALGRALAREDYSVRVIDVELSAKLSLESSLNRHASAYHNVISGESEDLFDPRSVPSRATHDLFGTPDGRSRSEITARQLAWECPAVTDYQLWRADTTQANPLHADRVLDQHWHRHGPGDPLQSLTTPAGGIRSDRPGATHTPPGQRHTRSRRR